MHSLQTRQAVENYQHRQIEKLMHNILPNFSFYQDYTDGRFESLPIIDKQILMSEFQRCNSVNFSADFIREAIAQKQFHIDNYLVGHSSGTSGNRGYYVISEAERFVWLGTLLAKTLPDALWKRHRVVIALPGLSELYKSASMGSRIQLALFDTEMGVHSWENDLVEFSPDTIVAAPKVLRYLAETGKLNAPNLFSGAEVLDPVDKTIIESISGRKIREIYMATEGLFGVSCRYGNLHLAEDAVRFEWESAANNSNLKKPIVTDFTRGTQAMTRYRMNDLLELSNEPCPCGSVFQRVNTVVGRADDIFHLADTVGKLTMVTPDVIRNSIVDAHPSITDYRAIQTGPNHIIIQLPHANTVIEEAIAISLKTKLSYLNIAPALTFIPKIDASDSRKLRRVRREWTQ